MGKIITKPSPGPWRELDHHGLPVKDAGCCVVSGMKGVGEGKYKVVAMMAADVSNCRGVKGDWSMFPDHHVMWANRRLVCASRSLLDAVKTLMMAVSSRAAR